MPDQVNEPIAILGSGCRFPGGSNSLSSLWNLLNKPRDLLKKIPIERFNPDGHYHPNGSHHGTNNVKHSYFLEEDIRHFDAPFFNIKPVEADSIDPQQLVLMETIFESMESAGLTINGLQGSDTAIYVGSMSADYENLLLRDIDSLPTYMATGVARSIIANRISYFFDWHGPSMMIDTACSSSMIALHLAVQALRRGESRVAVAAGTNLILGPENYDVMSKMNFLSPTGRSRMWDEAADGYGRGEGVAAVVLKKLSDAIKDGDHIECVIRETGINQDGRTSGITVPSTEAQSNLIRSTYAKAGLDINNSRDGPQFFEAHGTGTKAGDPREAEAIATAFFGPQYRSTDKFDKLYVGSIKTVIGHTEGTAGLAGVLKGSLALQHGIIPPNLLLNKLDPALRPYSDCLQIPTVAKPWPVVEEGLPRRVSVGSFGFGGTNDCILESYVPSSTALIPDTCGPQFTPFTFSAASERSLIAQLRAYSEYLSVQKSTSLRDLAWTLQYRRSALPLKTSFSASTVDQLISKIDEKLAHVKKDAGTLICVRSSTDAPRILGIFTGQGAQWATMGAQLLSSPFVRKRLRHLEDSLAKLPWRDRPKWLIIDELLADASTSRVAEAEISQPLCTAIQIVAVDVLKAAGITFAAVVGHSSGDVAAAYAAGFISAHDAIRIAYYRGLFMKLTSGPEVQRGAMLAVQTSLENATEICQPYDGRLVIAAYNSSTSMTLSGDLDAILEVKGLFEGEKKFVRLLKVPAAYHCQRHMLPCSDPYLESLKACKIQVNCDNDSSCTWYSSVLNGKAMNATANLQDVYWRDNMVNPVLFSAAMASATQSDVNFALEIGPHPALKSPATQNILDFKGTTVPYCGVLHRGVNDVESLSDCLGYLWAHFGSSAAIDFESFEKVLSAAALPKPKLLTGLPSYQWDHSRVHFYESRISRKFRTRSEPFNELLGSPCPDNTIQEMRWRNVLKLSEIEWLNGHQLQGQTVFPGAGYPAMALEAAMILADKEREVKLIELQDFVIGRAIAFENDSNFGVETLVTLTGITQIHPNLQIQEADFWCYSSTRADSSTLELAASGHFKIVYGKSSSTTLTSAPLEKFNLVDIDSDRFYSTLLEMGYGYSGPFRMLSSLKRKFNQASGLTSTLGHETSNGSLLLHPALLDTAAQTVLLCLSTPGDGRLWSLHVPTSFKRLRINPYLFKSLPPSSTKLPVDANLNEIDSIGFGGNVNLYSENGLYPMVQMEGFTLVPFSPATAVDDRCMFAYTRWGPDAPNAASVTGEDFPSVDDEEIANLCERLAFYFFRKWKREITEEEWARGEVHHHRLLDAINHFLSLIATGTHPTVKKEWSSDTYDKIRELTHKFSEKIDPKVLWVVGENMPAVVRGETTMLEHMMKDNILEDLYKKGIGYPESNRYLAKTVSQLAHRYPHMRILEIGAGTGGATRGVLDALNNSFFSYTFTDISTGFFEKAIELFKNHRDRMIFKAYDVEIDAHSQGFKEHSYDLIIASNVLHATKSLQKTLENTRSLLKPGGYLFLLEITSNDPIRGVATLGGLPGWWCGVEDGRRWGPTVPVATWDKFLRKSGFSGVDTVTPDRASLTWVYSIITSQAIDDRVKFLRRPLSFSPETPIINELVIVGNNSPQVSKLAEQVAEIMRKYSGSVTVLESLPEEADCITPLSTFVNLTDLGGSPVFRGMTQKKMDGLKQLFQLARNLLWVTHGCHVDEPYHMASVGFGRSLRAEMSHIGLQFLDLDNLEANAPQIISESLLRLCATDEWSRKDNSSEDLLWIGEPELVLQSGQLLVPRMVPNDDQNARINSSRRIVTKDLALRTSVVTISRTNGSVLLRDEPLRAPISANFNIIEVKFSLLSALRIAPDAFLFLQIGTLKRSDTLSMVLSKANSSIVEPVAYKVLPNYSVENASALLSAVFGELLANSLLSKIPAGSNLLVHEPPAASAPALVARAISNGIKITFSTSNAKSSESQNCIQLSPWMAGRAMKAKLPAALTHFVDFTMDLSAESVALEIESCLPPGCVTVNISDLFCDESYLGQKRLGILSDLLKDAVSRATSNLPRITSNSISLTSLTNTEAPLSPIAVVDWTVEDAVSVRIQSLDAKLLFSKNKTYLLVGLSGQIGQSLCEWMARNGAGCVCLTSRNPKVEETWLESFKSTGTIVKVFPMDITDKRDLKRVYDEISTTLPPIAGVANGAMVLRDTLFSGMSLEMMESVLKPKIDGSNNLDELFYNVPLDFFVLFSSAASVYGSIGQSNYAAANTYLTSLVNKRRKRGFAASSFDIGQVVGIGYLERADEMLQEQLLKYRYMPISESDFHQLFAETIRAGRPELGENPVITTGIGILRDDDKLTVPWRNNPVFSHLIIEAKETMKIDGKKTTVSAANRLACATNKDEALEIMKECFSTKLQLILQLDEHFDHRVPLVELGVDSLIAVEVRSWFLKELETDMPVLKVLGGGSVADLCQHALEKLPEKLVPMLHTELNGKPGMT